MFPSWYTVWIACNIVPRLPYFQKYPPWSLVPQPSNVLMHCSRAYLIVAGNSPYFITNEKRLVDNVGIIFSNSNNRGSIFILAMSNRFPESPFNWSFYDQHFLRIRAPLWRQYKLKQYVKGLVEQVISVSIFTGTNGRFVSLRTVHPKIG